MTTALRLSSCLLLTVALVACNKSEPAATDAATQAPATPATETAAAPAQPATPAGNPDAAPVTLSMDGVQKYANALKNLAAAEKADATLDSAQNLSEEDSAQYQARLEANPKMRAAIEAAGLSVQEFAGIGDTLLGAMMAQGALEAGQLKTLPEGIDPASVEFVKQHKAELQAVMGGGEG